MNSKKIEEKLNNYRLFLTILSTIDVACIAWFVSNYNKVFRLIIYYDFFIITIITGIILALCYEMIVLTDKIK